MDRHKELHDEIARLKADLARAGQDNLELLELLRECERVLAMVPASDTITVGFLGQLQRSYVTPLILRIRDQFA